MPHILGATGIANVVYEFDKGATLPPNIQDQITIYIHATITSMKADGAHAEGKKQPA